jgi:hypothetical protein
VDPEKHRGESQVVLLDDGVIILDSTGRGTQTYRQIVQLLDLKATREWSHHEVGYDPVFGKLRVNWARILRADGSVMTETPDKLPEGRPPKEDLSYNHRAWVTVPLRELEPGMLVDLSYTRTFDSVMYGNEVPPSWRISSEDAPVVRSRFVIDLPTSVPLRMMERNLDFARKETVANGRRTLVWATRDVPRVRTEPFAGDSNGVFMSVWFSTIPSWEALGRWYARRSFERMVAGPKTQKKFIELGARARTWDDSLLAIYDYVAQDIQRSRAPIGFSDFQPLTPDETITNFIGDSQDKGLLLVTMLRLMNIDATLVIAGYPGSFTTHYASLFDIQGVLVRIVHGADTIFADPMSKDLPPGVLPRGMQGAPLLLIRSVDSATSTRSPQDSTGANESHNVIVGAMDSSGVIRWRQTTTLTGYTQTKARQEFSGLKSAFQIRADLQYVARSDLPGATADSLQTFDGRDYRAPAVFAFNAVGGRTRTDSTRTLMRLPFADFTNYVAAAEWLAQHTPRRFPIDVARIGGDSVVTYDLTLTLPAGWTALLPPNVNATGPFGTVTRTYAQSGRVLHLTQRVAGASGTVPPERATEILAWLRAATKDRAQYIVITHPQH